VEIAIYFTDGLGEFPEDPPNIPVLWVVLPGGLDSKNFPFGKVVRLIRSAEN
jgi:predicted metal-dependent peptidase